MRDELSNEQIESYRQNGFVVIEGFLSPDELAQWRAMVDEAVEQRTGQRMPPNTGQTGDRGGTSYYSRVFNQKVNLWMTHEGMRELMIDERLGRLAAQLEGVDGMRIWHDQALIKEPWGNPTAWHVDNPYWSFSSHHSTSLWLALDDVDMQNGCLYFLPGSHREAEHERFVSITEQFDGLFDIYPEWRDREPVAAPMKAGSCSFHNGLTAHGAGANCTPRRRRAMTCAYMPDGSTFNGKHNVLPPEYIETLTVGDVLDNDEQNPLLYHA